MEKDSFVAMTKSMNSLVISMYGPQVIPNYPLRALCHCLNSSMSSDVHKDPIHYEGSGCEVSHTQK